MVVASAQGDVFYVDAQGWHRASNVFGITTATRAQSFGQLKARHR